MRSPQSLVCVEDGKDATLCKIIDFCTVLNFLQQKFLSSFRSSVTVKIR